MNPLSDITVRVATTTRPHLTERRGVTVAPLTAAEEAEVLAFLGKRPTHTFGMTGFIRDNGLLSTHNRGTFLGCRDNYGQLEGVALIGHCVLFEARSKTAIRAFARAAQRFNRIHLVLGEEELLEYFWSHYVGGGQAPRLFCRELLFELRWPVEVQQTVAGLRPATVGDLDLIVPEHARTVVAESGIDPLEVDPAGFRQRCQRRIEKGHTWVLVENGKLVFKAEIVADIPDVVYLEGVEVNPEERGKGYAVRCISQLSRILLRRTRSICLLVNGRNTAAQALYRRAGYRLTSYYETIFLKNASNSLI